jgi:histidine triad (HIT) family protein
VSCVFCSIAEGSVPAHLVLDEPEVVAFLDARPVFKGHVLVAPRAHVHTLLDVSEELMPVLMRAAQRTAAAVVAGLGSQGSFVAMNNVVSQSVPHLHVHVVPRRRKDGLRGFFWPRNPYRDDQHAEQACESLRAAVDRIRAA